MKSPIQKRAHIIKEVTFPSLTFQSKTHCGQCDIWLGEKLAKEVAFIFVFILSKPIFLCSVACWFSFCEVVILYNLIFQKKKIFAPPFCGFA